MKLRTPRTKIPKETYWQGMAKLFHPLMFAPIMMLVVMGSFLAEEIYLDRLILTLVGVFLAVLCAYHLDEFREKVTAPNVSETTNFGIAYLSGIAGTIIGLHLCVTISPILAIPMMIAFIGIVLYNMDIIKSRILYALSWGGTPIFGSYLVQTGELPNLTVIIFTIFGMLLSIKLFWAWSLRTCGRYRLCPKNCQIITVPCAPGYTPDAENRYCHSPNTMKCIDRLQVPREINDTVKVLQKLDLLILFMLMIGVVIM